MKQFRWRLYNITLVMRCLAHILIFGTRRKIAGQPKKIVIVQGAKLGDMVCTTPLFRAVNNLRPRPQLIVVGNKINQRLLENHPDVDKYIVWQNNFSGVVKALKKEKADFGCLLLPSLQSLALLILSGTKTISAPRVIGGNSPYETTPYRMVRNFVIAIKHNNGSYTPREYLRLLEPIGIVTAETKKYLTYSPEALEKIKEFFRKNNIDYKNEIVAGIVPSVGGDELKLWAADKFAEVAAYLYKNVGVRVLIIGTGKDKQQVDEMIKHIPADIGVELPQQELGTLLKTVRERDPAPKDSASAPPPSNNSFGLSGAGVINTLNNFSIDELKALIASLSLLISADTGPIYIAEAFKTPTIDILGPVDEKVQPPRGELHRVVFAKRNKPMLAVVDNFPSDMEEARRQSQAVTTEMVNKAIDELMPLIRQHLHG